MLAMVVLIINTCLLILYDWLLGIIIFIRMSIRNSRLVSHYFMFLFVKNSWLFSRNVVWIFKIKSSLLFAREATSSNRKRDRLQPHKFINTPQDIHLTLSLPTPPKKATSKNFPKIILGNWKRFRLFQSYSH